MVITCDNQRNARSEQEQEEEEESESPSVYDHFARRHLKRYSKYHRGAQGIAVLGFEVGAGELAKVRERYLALHPKLAALGPPRKYAATTTTRTAEKGDEDEDTTTIKMQTKKTIITTVTLFDVFA